MNLSMYQQVVRMTIQAFGMSSYKNIEIKPEVGACIKDFLKLILDFVNF